MFRPVTSFITMQLSCDIFYITVIVIWSHLRDRKGTSCKFSETWTSNESHRVHSLFLLSSLSSCLHPVLLRCTSGSIHIVYININIYIKAICQMFNTYSYSCHTSFCPCSEDFPPCVSPPLSFCVRSLKGPARVLRGLFWECADSWFVQAAKNNQAGLLQVPGTPERRMMVWCVFYRLLLFLHRGRREGLGKTKIDDTRDWVM